VTKSRPRRDDRPATRSPTPANPRSYAALSSSPLHALVFLLPILVIFEVGLVYVLTSGDGTIVEDIRARRLLAFIFDIFGAPGLSLVPLAAAIVLFIEHVVRRDAWKLRPVVFPVMLAECVLWAIPLFVLGQVVFAIVSGLVPPAAAMTAGDAGGAAAAAESSPWLPLAQNLTRAAGAGIYEELVFRLGLIGVLHILLADVIGLKHRTATIIALVVSSVAFALYHDLTRADGSFDVAQFAFFVFAGFYFGAAFLLRGFGIAVGVHVIYDLMAFQAAGG
jgi:membrane protease YdiL (CAAX protease family)